jgi:pimeloyl-ACP methyl ester carboxylesterase
MTDAADYQASGNGDTPLDSLGVMASQDVMISPFLRHAEFFTMRGLLTVLWHEPAETSAQSPLAIVACGGAMGGLLGPANGLYQVLGERCAARGIPVLRVDYRRPNDMDSCCVDVAAAAQLAIAGGGADRVVLIGHSFGGAVAVRVGVGLGDMVAGVVTLATQSAGCEIAGGLRDTPLLLFHGDRDEILPLQASEVVRSIAGTGELVVLANDGHLLAQSGPIILEKLERWLNALPGVQF